jgi:cysteine desulfurase
LSKPFIYADHAATTPLRREVLDAMAPVLTENFGNPSSLHQNGKAARKAFWDAVFKISALLKSPTDADIIFTSGATEANNMAIKGIAWGLQHKGQHIITSQIEHSATLEPCQWLTGQGWDVTFLPVDAEGFVSPHSLKNAIRPDTVLISLIHGNNEVGTLQPIELLGQIAREKQVFFHLDAVQTIGKIPIALDTMPVDLLSCSAHKLYGPKGVGFLYANTVAREVLTPLIHGGGQQRGFRSGTENLAGVVGLATALELAIQEMTAQNQTLYALQEKLMAGILETVPTARLNGPRNVIQRVPGNVNFSFPPLDGEGLVLRFDLQGICISSGSACHDALIEGSHVLQAMGAGNVAAKSAIRFSLGYQNTSEEVDRILEGLPRVLRRAGYEVPSPPLGERARVRGS